MTVVSGAICSGSCSDIGSKTYMEDEHIRVDDLSAHLGGAALPTSPSAFYGVFDGHGGSEAAAYLRRSAVRLFFEDTDFPSSEAALKGDDCCCFLERAEESVRRSFLQADLELADDDTVGASCGTTALTAMVFGRHLLVANAGDCRAVLCRKGEAVDMSEDHRPSHVAERRRIEKAGGYVDDGYLNGVLSVTRALGDWEMKLPRGSASPLIAEPEFRRARLTDDDEFLILGCDGIWDVMSSQQAVCEVRRGLRRHADPARCASELVKEATRLHAVDNLTVIVVRLSTAGVEEEKETATRERSRWRKSALSTDALDRLRTSLLRNDDSS